MVRSQHEHRDPQGHVLVEVGDELNATVVEALDKAHAVRMPNSDDQADEALVRDAAAELDEAAARAGRILAARLEVAEGTTLTEGQDTDELVDMIESARELIAEAAGTLRAVCDATDDAYRGSTLVANLESLVGTGGWMALESETLDGWIQELTTDEEV